MSRTLPLASLLCAAAGLLPSGGALAAPGDACTASAATLDGARRAYADSCTVARVDCDPVGGGWMCSSERIGARAPGYAVTAPVPAAATPEPADATPAPTAAAPEPAAATPEPAAAAPEPASAVPTDERQGGACAASGADLGTARANYAASCSAARVDCDADNGTWTCASYRIGLGAPGGGGTATGSSDPTPAVGTPTASIPTPTPTDASALRAEAESGVLSNGWESEGDYIIWRGTPDRYDLASRGDDANIAWTLDVPVAGRYRFTMRSAALEGPNPAEPPNDLWVTFGDVPWTKAYMTRDRRWHVQAVGERGGEHSASLLESELPAGPVTVTISGRSTGHAVDWIALEPLDVAEAPRSTSDLIAVHFDSSYDPDDLQAMVAMRHILDRFPDRDLLVVNGTRTYRHDDVLPGSLEQARSLFPDTIDAQNDSRAEDKVATAWQLTLAAGNRVMVAEAGPSGFTARVLDRLEARGVRNLKNVVVVQHSHGWNEENTRADYLRTVQRLATYVRIENGNHDNGNPDFLEFNGDVANRFRARALRSRYAEAWRRSFTYFEGSQGQGRSVDFSDAVELMHILGIPKSQAPDVTGFADRYF